MQHIKLVFCLADKAAPQFHWKGVGGATEYGDEVVFEDLDGFLRNIASVIVGRNKLISCTVRMNCSFELT